MAGLVYLSSAEDISLGPVTQSVAPPPPSALPPAMRSAPEPDKSSFKAYNEWQMKTNGMAFPESELRQMYSCNPDGSLKDYLVSQDVRDALFAGLKSPEYERIRVPVLALYPLPIPLGDQLKRYKPENAEQGAAMGLKYGLDLAWIARNADDLKRRVRGARVVEVPNANVYIFLSNEPVVLRELRTFLAALH